MTNFIQKPFLLVIFILSIFSFGRICLAQEMSKTNEAEKTRLPKCSRNFTLKKLPNSISYIDEDIFTQGEGSDICSIGLKFSKSSNYDNQIFTIYAYSKKDRINEILKYNGFEKNKVNKWQFKGRSILLQPKKFTFLKTTEIKESDGFILIGQAIERGYISKGGPISLRIYEIVRETPDFNIDTEIVFGANSPPTTTNYLINELVNVVRNIKIHEK